MKMIFSMFMFFSLMAFLVYDEFKEILVYI